MHIVFYGGGGFHLPSEKYPTEFENTSTGSFLKIGDKRVINLNRSVPLISGTDGKVIYNNVIATKHLFDLLYEINPKLDYAYNDFNRRILKIVL